MAPKGSFWLKPLHATQIAKSRQLKEEWNQKFLAANNVCEKLLCKEKIRQFERLCWHGNQKWSTLDDFHRSDFEAYDAVNFELTQEHLHHLASIFSTPAFENGQKPLVDWGVDLKEAMVAEVLAKTLAYTQDLHGKEIHVPVNSSLLPYVIKGFYFGKELPGYILEPKGAGPIWVIARGTESVTKTDSAGTELRKGAMESIKADLHPESISRDAVTKALELENLKQVFTARPSKEIKMTGHSLGGALVTDLATRFPEHVSKVYTYCSPGLGRFEEQRWNPVLDKKLVGFNVRGDLIPCAGCHFKGLQIEVNLKLKGHPLIKHNEIVLNQPFKAAIIDNQRENCRKVRQRFAAIQRLQLRIIGWHEKYMHFLHHPKRL